MIGDALQLLKRLNPAVRPLSKDPAGLGASFESSGFDKLLTLMSNRAVSSGREVTINDALEPPLTDEQQRRLAYAADTAEAGGFERALLLIDGRGLVLDVPARSVLRELNAAASDRSLSLDGAVYVPSEEEELAMPVGEVVGPRLAVMPDIRGASLTDDDAVV